MTDIEAIIDAIKKDQVIIHAARLVATLKLNDWYIGAGFIRNFIWDHYFKMQIHEIVSDIDVIYFDRNDISTQIEKQYELNLRKLAPQYHWSVKNQARMHIRNGDAPYFSSLDAMSYWPEIQTAIGVCINENGEMVVCSPFLKIYKADGLTRNTKKDNINVFRERVKNRFWLSRWPELEIDECCG